MELFDIIGSTFEMQPALSKWGVENLGDDPALHRWRATWATGNLDGEIGGIWLRAYPVTRLTEAGAWIDPEAFREGDHWNMSGFAKRWISNSGRSAWAKPTQEEAIRSLAVRLSRWAKKTSHDIARIRSAARGLETLRPDLARFAEEARKHLAA